MGFRSSPSPIRPSTYSPPWRYYPHYYSRFQQVPTLFYIGIPIYEVGLLLTLLHRLAPFLRRYLTLIPKDLFSLREPQRRGDNILFVCFVFTFSPNPKLYSIFTVPLMRLVKRSQQKKCEFPYSNIVAAFCLCVLQ